MTINKKVTGIVLSGGKSSRMGTEKGLVRLNGKALIEYSVEAIQPVCDQVVISSNKDCYNYLNFPVVEDEIKDCGPLGGIYSCMKAYPSDVYIIISCDVPGVCKELFEDLLSELEDHDAVIPVDEFEKVQPLVGVYSKKSVQIFNEEFQKGNFKLMKLLDLLSCRYSCIDASKAYYRPSMFTNANTFNDLESL